MGQLFSGVRIPLRDQFVNSGPARLLSFYHSRRELGFTSESTLANAPAAFLESSGDARF